MRDEVRDRDVGSAAELRVDVSGAIPISTAEELDGRLAERAGTESALVVALFKKATGKQTVSFDELQEVALCHGWVDTLTQSIDDERYAIRFVPRRPGSSWSETNRRIARRLRDAGRMTPAGLATVPEDL